MRIALETETKPYNEFGLMIKLVIFISLALIFLGVYIFNSCRQQEYGDILKSIQSSSAVYEVHGRELI